MTSAAGHRGRHDATAKHVPKVARSEQASPPGTAASSGDAVLILAGRLTEKVTGQTCEASGA